MIDRHRSVEYAFTVEMMAKGKWEIEVGTRKLSQAMEVVSLYPSSRKVRISRCHDGLVMWQSRA